MNDKTKKIAIGVGIAIVAIALLMLVISLMSPKSDTLSGGEALDDDLLTVGVSIDLTDKGISWVETDIAKRVGEILGVPVELIPLVDENGYAATRTERLEALNSGRVDLLLAQIGWDVNFPYLTSVPYQSAGLYLGNPLGTYLDNLSVLKDVTLFVSDSIPSQVSVEVPDIGNVNQSPQQDYQSILQEIALSSNATREEYYLFTEEQAILLSLEENSSLYLAPLLYSPRMDYVAVANEGEGDIISACNQAITEYIEGRNPSNNASEETQEES